jgi:hypothetical protein
MRRAALMNENGDVWMSAYDRSRCAGVVEMNVREHDVRHVGKRETVLFEPSLERLQARGRPRVDQRYAGAAMNDSRRNCVWTPQEEQVDPGQPRGQRVHNTGSNRGSELMQSEALYS